MRESVSPDEVTDDRRFSTSAFADNSAAAAVISESFLAVSE